MFLVVGVLWGTSLGDISEEHSLSLVFVCFLLVIWMFFAFSVCCVFMAI